MKTRASIFICLLICFLPSTGGFNPRFVSAGDVAGAKEDYPGTQWEFIEDELLSVPWYTKLVCSPVPWLAGIAVTGVLIGNVSDKIGFETPADLLSVEKWKKSVKNTGEMLKTTWPLLVAGGILNVAIKYSTEWSLKTTIDVYILNRFFSNWEKSDKWSKSNMENTPEKLRPFLQLHYKCFKDKESGGLEYLFWNAEEITKVIDAAVELSKGNIDLLTFCSSS